MLWLIIGIILMVWALKDLISGSVWSYRKIYRKYEPGMYWFVLSIWFVLAGACFVPYVVWYL